MLAKNKKNGVRKKKFRILSFFFIIESSKSINRNNDDAGNDRRFVRWRIDDNFLDTERPAGNDAVRDAERGNDLHDEPPMDTDWFRISAPVRLRNVRTDEVDVEWRNKDPIDNEIVCTGIDDIRDVVRRYNVLRYDTNRDGRFRVGIGDIPNVGEGIDRRFLPIYIRIREVVSKAYISGKRSFHRNNCYIRRYVRNYFHRHRNRNNRIRRIGRTSR